MIGLLKTPNMNFEKITYINVLSSFYHTPYIHTVIIPFNEKPNIHVERKFSSAHTYSKMNPTKSSTTPNEVRSAPAW